MDLRKRAGLLALIVAAFVATFGGPVNAAPVLTITPGAFCSEHGATAIHNGDVYQCTPDADGQHWRWRRIVDNGGGEPTPTPTATDTPTPGTPGGGAGPGTSTKGTSTKTTAPVRHQPTEDQLPVTGAGAQTAALVGGVLLVVGLGAVIVTRRRRRSFTS